MNDINVEKYIQGCNRKNQFIFAGRLDKTKGIDKLLTVWKRLSTTGENIPQLIVCGTGPEEQWCQDFVQFHKLSSKVKLLGFVENSNVVKLIAESLALILPTQWYEGFPMTIVEAYRYGTPVLGSNIGNVGSLVIDDVTGYTFEPDSIDAILIVIQKILVACNSELDLYKNSFDYYSTYYTAVENYRILNTIYESVLKR